MWLIISIAGGLGAMCRFLLTSIIQKHFTAISFFATSLVNIIGSFLLGISFGISTSNPNLALYYGIISTGFFGAFTTFSTFSFEAYTLYLKSKRRGVLFILASMLSAIVFAAFGILIVT